MKELRLSDGPITIRTYSGADVEPLHAAIIESRDELAPWFFWMHPDYCRDDTSAWVAGREKDWDTGETYGFIIADTSTGAVLGGSGINQINTIHGFGNLGYWVRTNCTGRGIATAATLLTARFALGELGLSRVEIVVAIGNTASDRVAVKAGARREGVLRRRLRLDGTLQDATMYSLTAADLDGVP